MDLSSIDIWSLDIADFRYHATPFGNIFGFQPEWSEWYDSKYDDYEEMERFTEIDVLHKKEHLDLGPGFYLGNDIDESRAWGARFDWATPTLNIFDLSNVSGNGLVLDVLNNHDDLMHWVISTAQDRPKTGETQTNYDKLVSIFGQLVFEGVYDWILAPRSDDSMWSFTNQYLNGDITTEALLDCTNSLSAGYQLALKTQSVIDQLVFCEYERYNVGTYPALYKDGMINGYYSYLDIIGFGEYTACVSSEKESIDDIVGNEKFVLLV